jgi:hypothetical protein
MKLSGNYFGLAALLLTGACFCFRAEGQSIEELRLNTAPAFVLLGTTPTAVEQPSSPRALATSIFASQDDREGGSLLPRNLAFEFAPYWWFYGNDLTWEQYQTNDSPIFNIARTLTFSAATAETEFPAPNNTTTDGTGIGVGVRFSIWKGQPSQAAIRAKQALGASLNQIAEKLPDDPDEPMLIEDLTAQYGPEMKAYREAIRRRDGFQLEVAGGVAWGYPDDEFDDSHLKSAGLWVTPAYRSPSEGPLGDLQIVGVGRYLYHRLPTDNASSVDVGARLVWTVTGKPFSASAEYLRRFSDEDGTDSSRYAATIEYQVNQKMAVLLGFGQDFKSMMTKEDNAFVLLGLNFAILDAKAR